MKIYKTQEEVKKDIKNNLLVIKGDVTFECSISIKASIKVVTGNINARDIKAWDINAWNINAGNINVRDINARDILYYAFCFSYNSIECSSIKAGRAKHSKPICLDGELKIINKEEEKVTIKISKKSLEALKESGIEIVD